MKCDMDHIVLNMEDDEKMINFYAGILMLETERLEEYRTGKVPFPSVRMNADTIIDLFPKRMWQNDTVHSKGRENLNHFCLSMDRKEWLDLLARLSDKNVSIEDGPVRRWGAHGTGISMYFRDPEGNLIEARYYEKSSQPGKCLLGS